MHWHDLIYKMGRHLPGSHTQKGFPEKSVNLGWQKHSQSGFLLKQKWVGVASILHVDLCCLKATGLITEGENSKRKLKRKALNSLSRTSLYLVGTYIRIFYFLFKFFRNAVTFLKVEWLSNLSCKAYNVTTAFHNRNKQKKVFAACYFQLILAMTAGFSPC